MAWTSSRRRRRNGAEKGPGWTRRRKLAVAGLAAAVVGLLGGYLVSTQVIFPGPEPPGDLAQVPDLRGATVADARSRLGELDLVAAPADSMHHPEIGRGEIVAQTPLPGQLARPGGQVRLTVSTGPESVLVPEVEGLRAERAEAVLETVGFTVVVDSVDADVAPGRVVYAEPGAGAEVRLPREVTLAVSRGPPTVTMPRLVGLMEEEATATLDSLGLVVGEVERVFRFGTDPGRVVEQSPESGATVERGSAVRLTVGRRSRNDPPGDPGAPGDPDAHGVPEARGARPAPAGGTFRPGSP